MRLPRKYFIVPVIFTSLIAVTTAPVSGAFFIPDLLTPVREFFQGTPSKTINIEPSINLAPDGDVNKNGEIDAGDSITFSYKIKNLTDKSYTFATLKTAVPRDQLNFIRNLSGATGMKDNDNTITISNLRIKDNSEVVVSFDARINYYTGSDKAIGTTPDLVDSNGASLTKSNKKEVTAKKLSQEEFDKRVKPAVKKGEQNAQ